MRDERPQKLVATVSATCARCGRSLTLNDWGGYIVGRPYGFSHCGLIQTTTAVQA